jgi:hypothetical protein
LVTFLMALQGPPMRPHGKAAAHRRVCCTGSAVRRLPLLQRLLRPGRGAAAAARRTSCRSSSRTSWGCYPQRRASRCCTTSSRK